MFTTEIKAILFHMDGVVTDTEYQYEAYWVRLQNKYGLEMDDFVARVKGARLKDIVTNFFSYLPLERQTDVAEDIKDFEMNEMQYSPINGVDVFIRSLRDYNLKTALITSSIREKTEKALNEMKLKDCFDVIVTADDVINGKPDPQCYRMGSERLGIDPGNCLVFEDSFSGIEAATKAGMKVIGVATSHSIEELEKKVSLAIPDFSTLTINQILIK